MVLTCVIGRDSLFDEKIDEMFIAKKRDTFERDFDFARISYIIHRIKREVNDI